MVKSRYKRRPSFDIAEQYVEMNFKAIMEAEKASTVSPDEQQSKKRKERHFVHRKLFMRVAATILAVVLSIALVVLWWRNSISPIDANDTTPRQFVVTKGDSSSNVAHALKKAGFIKNELVFKIYIKWYGNIIQAGTHMLSPSYSLPEVVKHLAVADTDEVDVQIPPGMTIKYLKEKFKKYDFTAEQIEKAFNREYQHPILASKPKGASLEGYLFPDTYRILGRDSLDKLIIKTLDQLQEVSHKYQLEQKFAAHGLNFHEGLTMASIIAKEVSHKEDKAKVASVFYNRLGQGMNLGSDPTYKYAYSQGLCAVNSPSGCDSNYNTRINKGLPPTPIANPSLADLLAVAEPEDTNYLYFVSDDNGKTYFSETADQHNKAVAEHCGELCK